MNYPFEDIQLKDCAARIDNKEYWDSLSDEWNNSSEEHKLLVLGDFILKGGDLNEVLNRYAERHEEAYRREIQNVVLLYLAILMTGDAFSTRIPLSDRIKRLNKEELVQLLTEELRRNTIETGDINSDGSVRSYWIIGKGHLLDDSILDKIERKHWRDNPNESFSSYLKKAELNWNYSKSIW